MSRQCGPGCHPAAQPASCFSIEGNKKHFLNPDFYPVSERTTFCERVMPGLVEATGATRNVPLGNRRSYRFRFSV
jgi:hypothetical protein